MLALINFIGLSACGMLGALMGEHLFTWFLRHSKKWNP